jgi:hypothetical protein
MRKFFDITYEAKAVRIATILAKNEEDALQKFNSGHGYIEKEVDLTDVKIIKNEENKDE